MFTTSVLPAVSIIIPSYNRGYCIAQCIQSALNQTFTDFEIIVVDDASNDDTQAQVMNIFDSRIHYLTHETNRGGAVARNTGIRIAQGEFVAFLDSDDYWQPDKLEKQIASLRRLGPQWGLSYTWLSCVDEDGMETLRINPEIEGACFEEMLVKNFMGTFSNIVVRKSLLIEVGALDESFRSCQDWDLFIRLTRRASVHCLREYAVRYLLSASDQVRISTNPRSVIQGHRRILHKYADDYSALALPYRRRALGIFMRVFADAGSLSDAITSGFKRLCCGLSLVELKDSAHLMLRVSRKSLMMKMHALRRA
ncbi:MAG: glycosyltransferase family 2 protein [Glaciimonas sp.]|nr:glycosyltransferase family 2 protein [Glaciimonas sp.]